MEIGPSSTMAPITDEIGEQTKCGTQNLVTVPFGEYWARVAVSYGTGHRPGIDAKGCGPGMEYAAVSVAGPLFAQVAGPQQHYTHSALWLCCVQSLIHTLKARGIDTISGLHIPPGVGECTLVVCSPGGVVWYPSLHPHTRGYS